MSAYRLTHHQTKSEKYLFRTECLMSSSKLMINWVKFLGPVDERYVRGTSCPWKLETSAMSAGHLPLILAKNSSGGHVHITAETVIKAHGDGACIRAPHADNHSVRPVICPSSARVRQRISTVILPSSMFTIYLSWLGPHTAGRRRLEIWAPHLCSPRALLWRQQQYLLLLTLVSECI